ncbi:hypothetical protein [Pseudomonas panipatensis]|uniref:hypothetical protein n=1 Tax=Pseudomonas panipatensis TaxID=428992 RepID=UPI00147F950C|nr:hypothetical protein [Pseudomonas panipatensis]
MKFVSLGTAHLVEYGQKVSSFPRRGVPPRTGLQMLIPASLMFVFGGAVLVYQVRDSE